MSNDGTFMPYDLNHSEVIETSFRQHKQLVTLPINNMNYNIVFGEPHYQVLPNSNIKRVVRRIDESGQAPDVDVKKSPNEITWYWKNDSKKFEPYTAEASRLIEIAYHNRQRGEKSLVQGSNIKGYLIDFDKMKQINEITNFQRDRKSVV